MLTKPLVAPVVGLVTTLLVGVAGERLFHLELERAQQDQRSTVTNDLAHYRAALEAELNASLFLTNGLVAYVETHRKLDPDDAEAMLRTLYEQGKNIRNIGLAPGNRLTYLYPIKGNESAIGLYYPDQPDQWPAVQRAMKEDRPQLAGPVSLVQGGSGFIYRVPIFLSPDGQYWGMLSMVLDKEGLLGKVGLAPHVGDMAFALRGKDGLGAAGKVFMGNPDLFSSDALTATIVTPGGDWQIAGRPIKGWITDKRLSWLRLVSWALALLLGGLVYAVLLGVASRLRAEESVKRARDELNEAQRIAKIGSWSLDVAHQKLTWSPEIYRIFELSEEGFGATYDAFLDRVHPDDREMVHRIYQESIAQKEPYEIVHRLLFDDHRIKYVREHGETTYDKDGHPVLSRGTVQDVTRLREMELELIHLARTDPLTGVANRRRFMEHLEMELARFRRYGTPAAFLMLDIDFFKKINDTHGHAVGDEVLKRFSEIAGQRIRQTDFLGRLGGEEFGILLQGTDLEGAMTFAEQFRQVIFDNPVETSQGPVEYSVSIGLSVFNTEDSVPDGILIRADTALYRAKQAGRNRVEAYEATQGNEMDSA